MRGKTKLIQTEGLSPKAIDPRLKLPLHVLVARNALSTGHTFGVSPNLRRNVTLTFALMFPLSLRKGDLILKKLNGIGEK